MFRLISPPVTDCWSFIRTCLPSLLISSAPISPVSSTSPIVCQNPSMLETWNSTYMSTKGSTSRNTMRNLNILS